MLTRYRLRLSGIALLVAAVIMCSPYLTELWAIDHCLDTGGSYDYAKRICDLRQSHAVQSAHMAHIGKLLFAGLSGATGMVLVMLGRPGSTKT